MKRIAFYLLLFIIPFNIYGQEKSEFSKTIPVVRYLPDSFLPAIDGSFVHSIESLNIHIQNGDTVYIQNRSGKLTSYDNDFFNVNHIDTKPFFTTDSVFIVSLKNESVSLPNIPIYRIYGIKRNGKYLFGLTNGEEKLYPFKKMLEVRYGSVEKFKEIYKSYIDTLLSNLDEKDKGISIFPDNKEEMKAFLKNDHLIHERHNPTDTANVVNKFMSLVESFTVLSQNQEQLIRTGLMKNIRRNPDAHPKELKVTFYKHSAIIIYEVDVRHVLSNVLTAEQFEKVRLGIYYHNSIRQHCIEKLQLYKVPKTIWNNQVWSDFISYDNVLKQTADAVLREK